MSPSLSPAARTRRALALALALAAVLAARPAAAQTAHEVRVGFGYVHHAVLDRAATSLVYDGHLVGGSLTYRADTQRLRWTTRLSGSFGHVASSGRRGRVIRFESQQPDGSPDSVSVPMLASVLRGGAALRLERVVSLGGLDLLVGGEVDFGVTYAQGFVAPGLMQRIALGPTLGARIPLPRGQRVELSAHTVLGAWVTRMPYDQTVSAPGQTPYQGLVARGSGFRSMGHLQTLALDAAYQRDLGARAAIRASVGLGWLHDTRPRPLRVLDASAELSVALRIGDPT